MLTDSVSPISSTMLTPLRVGPYVVDPANCTVQVDDGPRISLTRFEMGILVQLTKKPGTTVSKEQLAEALYPGVNRPQSNGLEVFVKRIRQKIDPCNVHKPVQTVRFAGYQFRGDWGSHAAA